MSYCSPAGRFKCMLCNNCFFQSLFQLRNFKRSQLQFNHTFRKEKNKLKVKHTRHPVFNVNFRLKKTKLVFPSTSNTMSSLWPTYPQVFCILLWSRFVKEPSVLSDWPEIKEQLSSLSQKLWVKYSQEKSTKEKENNLIIIYFITYRKISDQFATLETRRELEPKFIPQLFLGWLLGTRRSAIGWFLCP